MGETWDAWAALCPLRALMTQEGPKEAHSETAGSGTQGGSWEGRESWASEGLSTRGERRIF